MPAPRPRARRLGEQAESRAAPRPRLPAHDGESSSGCPPPAWGQEGGASSSASTGTISPEPLLRSPVWDGGPRARVREGQTPFIGCSRCPPQHLNCSSRSCGGGSQPRPGQAAPTPVPRGTVPDPRHGRPSAHPGTHCSGSSPSPGSATGEGQPDATAGTPRVCGQGWGEDRARTEEHVKGQSCPAQGRLLQPPQPRAPARLGADPSPSPLRVPASSEGPKLPAMGSPRRELGECCQHPAYPVPTAAVGAVPRALEVGGSQAAAGRSGVQGGDVASPSHPICFPGEVAVPDDGNALDDGQPEDRGDRVHSHGLQELGSRGHGRVATCASGARSRSLRFAPVARSGQRRRQR